MIGVRNRLISCTLFTYSLSSVSKDVQSFIDLCNDYIKFSFEAGLIEVARQNIKCCLWLVSDGFQFHQVCWGSDFSNWDSVEGDGITFFSIL